MKDSEVQPPNPVPPESQSIEKIPETKMNIIKKEEKKLIQIPDIKESNHIDKISETHPRNLKTKLEAKMANGNSNGEAEKPKEVKTQSSEDKIDMIKQQKLIETIKQHGKEQKELIKEQKEILDEIMKTKKELQKNKDDLDTNEAKKIAVESIKQIANMAIQSIGGVSEKPEQVKNDVKVERLEKLTNEAVQEIAKKAVETIEALQEIKENPEEANAAKVVQSNLPNVKTNVQPNLTQNVQSNQNVPLQIPVNPQILQAVNPQILLAANPPVVQPKIEEPKNVAANVNSLAKNNVASQNDVAPNIIPQPNKEVKPVVNEKPKEVAQIPNNIKNQPQQIVNKVAPVQQSDAAKPHSHSPDEPQSYKEGEDIQAKQPETKIVQNVPQPIVNELANNHVKTDKESVVPTKLSDEDIKVNVPPKPQPVNNNANLQSNVNPVIARQKREVVDCTEKVSLKKEDKQICNTLVDRSKIKDPQSQEILPKVDMNEIALQKTLPLDSNMLHIGRSLKSYDKDER